MLQTAAAYRYTPDEKTYKLYSLDVGLMNRQCGIDNSILSRIDEIKLVNEGSIAEQFAAQHLMYFGGSSVKPQGYYWLRENGKNNAEVDFVIQNGTEIIPIEIKSGKSGSLRSLHRFMYEKKLNKAVRFDLNKPSVQHVRCRISTGEEVSYDLCSLPLYAICELKRLVEADTAI